MKYRFCSKQPDTKLLLPEGDSHKVGSDTGKVQIISHIPLFGSPTAENPRSSKVAGVERKASNLASEKPHS